MFVLKHFGFRNVLKLQRIFEVFFAFHHVAATKEIVLIALLNPGVMEENYFHYLALPLDRKLRKSSLPMMFLKCCKTLQVLQVLQAATILKCTRPY